MDEPAELVELETVRRGDGALEARKRDIELIFEHLQSELFGFALHASRNNATAEEIVQEAFLRLIHEARAGRYPDNPRAWLYRVCANLVTSRGRRQVVAERWRRYLVRDRQPQEPDTSVLGRERADTVAAALATLPHAQRVAFLLALEGFHGPEIARLLGKNEAAARTTLFRARSRIRAAVAEAEADR